MLNQDSLYADPDLGRFLSIVFDSSSYNSLNDAIHDLKKDDLPTLRKSIEQSNFRSFIWCREEWLALVDFVEAHFKECTEQREKLIRDKRLG